MAEQERKQRRVEAPPPGEGGQSNARLTEKGQKLKADMDELMDEIDELLEQNAEEFIQSYLQRGGGIASNEGTLTAALSGCNTSPEGPGSGGLRPPDQLPPHPDSAQQPASTLYGLRLVAADRP